MMPLTTHRRSRAVWCRSRTLSFSPIARLPVYERSCDSPQPPHCYWIVIDGKTSTTPASTRLWSAPPPRQPPYGQSHYCHTDRRRSRASCAAASMVWPPRDAAIGKLRLKSTRGSEPPNSVDLEAHQSLDRAPPKTHHQPCCCWRLCCCLLACSSTCFSAASRLSQLGSPCLTVRRAASQRRPLITHHRVLSPV